MTEEKVRNAVKIANELVPYSTTPEFAYVRLWELVFSALTYDPYWASNATAAGVEAMQSTLGDAA